MEENLKQLLLKDLCARLPYGVFINTTKGDGTLDTIQVCCNNDVICGSEKGHEIIDCVKPYLRPMSSMTEEEKEEFREVINIELKSLDGEGGHNVANAAPAAFEIDFYNAHHFDYRGLIEKGLALEAPEDMYVKTESL